MSAPAASKRPEWMQREERGCVFWLTIMRWLSLLFGRRLTRPILWGIAAYFLLAVPAARKASCEYLRRATGQAPGWGLRYRHILAFATTIHDRVFLLNDRSEDFLIEWHGLDALHEQARSGGLFLFGAHLGSFELLRTLARDDDFMPVSLAMYPDNARRLNAALAAINPRVMQDVIALGQLDAMLTIHQRLQAGNAVGILADRASGEDRYLSLPFLGSTAHFPTGPFRMAALLKRPVIFMAGLYLGGRRYAVHFEPVADFSSPAAGGQEAAIEAAMRAYVAILERHCRAQPCNWFNFFDFWDSARHDPH